MRTARQREAEHRKRERSGNCILVVLLERIFTDWPFDLRSERQHAVGWFLLPLEKYHNIFTDIYSIFPKVSSGNRTKTLYKIVETVFDVF